MMKKIICLLALCFILSSCTEDDGPNFNFTALEIDAADLPESFELRQRYRITVNYALPGDCAAFEGFNIKKDSTTVRSVVAVGSVRTDRENCSEEPVEGQASFNFVVIYKQPYRFRFYQGEDSEGEPQFLEVVVPVN